jgi:hypothetical protein
MFKIEIFLQEIVAAMSNNLPKTVVGNVGIRNNDHATEPDQRDRW